MLFKDADGLDRVRINVLNPKMHTVHIASLLKILKEKVAEQGKQPEQQGRVIMIAKAWNNGGRGYGIQIQAVDRYKYFKREWKTVRLYLQGESQPILVNIDKDSFWTPSCGELIKKEIGTWLENHGKKTWDYDNPPILMVEPISERNFAVTFG